MDRWGNRELENEEFDQGHIAIYVVDPKNELEYKMLFLRPPHLCMHMGAHTHPSLPDSPWEVELLGCGVGGLCDLPATKVPTTSFWYCQAALYD